LEGVGYAGEFQEGGHLSVIGWGSGLGGTTDVHTEEEVSIPVDGTGEVSKTPEVYRDVAVGYSDTVIVTGTDAITVVVGFGPFEGTTTTTGAALVEFELDVVVTIGGDGTTTVF
jgi:hypothetical protein